jgi:Tfp pilus assembly major pilin PilA
VHVGPEPRPSPDQSGFGLVSIVISLGIVAILSVVALKSFAGTTGSAAGAQGLHAPVDQAYDVAAQSTLSSAMQNVRDGALSNGAMSASDLGQYGVITGASTSASEVSGAVAPSGASASAGAGAGAGGAPGYGSVTLAAQAKSGSCWYVWFSSSSTWFGVQPDATTCVAAAMPEAPTPGAPSPGAIGWQQGSFPVTG